MTDEDFLYFCELKSCSDNLYLSRFNYRFGPEFVIEN